MARRRSPENKAQSQAPENKRPFTDDDDELSATEAHTEVYNAPHDDDEDVVNGEDQMNESLVPDDDDDDDDDDEEQDELTTIAVLDNQLRRLLKAENNEWVGTIGRQELRRIANVVRSELQGNTEAEMGGTDD